MKRINDSDSGCGFIARMSVPRLGTLLLLVLLAAAVLLCVSASADGNETDGETVGDVPDHSKYFAHKESVITGWVDDQVLLEDLKNLGTIYVPQEMDGYTITSIGAGAFSSRYDFTLEFVFPSTVKRVEEAAFFNSKNLVFNDLSDIVYFGSKSFRNCGQANLELTNADLIGYLAFSKVTSIGTEIKAPVATYIDKDAFEESKGFTRADFGGQNIAFGEGVFNHCPDLEYADLGLYHAIPADMFLGCGALKEVTSGIHPKAVGPGAFKDSGVYSIPTLSAATEIGVGAFENCTKLQAPVDLSSLNIIGESVFKGCRALTGVMFSDSLTQVSPTAFADIAGAGSPALFDGVAADYVFDGGLYVKGKVFDTRSMGEGRFTTDANVHFDFFRHSGSTITGMSEEKALPSDVTELYIPDFIAGSRIDSIGANAFCPTSTEGNCFGKNVTAVYLPDTWGKVFIIGENAFRDCNWLVSFKTAGGAGPTDLDMVFDIGSYAFYNCSSLKGIVILEVSTGEFAFSNCTSLDGGRLGCDGIGRGVFEGCTGLTDSIILSGVTVIPESAYRGCTSIEGILMIPDSVTDLKPRAFENCSSIRQLDMSNGIERIGLSVFEGCTSLEGLIMPDTLVEIGPGAFRGCDKMGSVRFGSGLTEVQGWAFGDCHITNLDFRVADSLTWLDPVAFTKMEKGVNPYLLPTAVIDGVHLSEFGPEKSADLVRGHQFYLRPEQPADYWDYTSGHPLVSVDGRDVEYRYPDQQAGPLTLNEKTYFRFDSETVAAVSAEDPSIMKIGTASFKAQPGSVWYADNLSFKSITVAPGMSFVASKHTPASAFEWEFRTDGAYVKKYIGTDTDVDIPATVENGGAILNVVGIMAGSFSGNTSLTSVCIPDTVKVIEDASSKKGAFEGCTALVSVHYSPASESRIGDRAFADCSSLKGFEPSANVRSVGDFAFLNAFKSGGDLKVGNGVTVGEGAFRGCVFASLTVDSGNYSAGVFADCQIGSLRFGPGLDSIPARMFENASFKTDSGLTIGISVKGIGASAFGGFGRMVSLDVPAGSALTDIGEGAFADCVPLAAIDLQEAPLASVYQNAFSRAGEVAVFDGTPLSSDRAANAELVSSAEYRLSDTGFPDYVSEGDVVKLTAGDSKVIYDGGSLNPGETVTVKLHSTVQITVDPTYKILTIDGKKYTITGDEVWFESGAPVPYSGGSSHGGVHLYAMLCKVSFVVNGSGEVISEGEYPYGTAVEMSREDPVVIIGGDRFEAVPEAGYQFSHWSPVVSSVTGHMVFTAYFDSASAQVTVHCGHGGHVEVPGVGMIGPGETLVLDILQGDRYSVNGAVLTIGGYKVMAVADSGYSHPSWNVKGSGVLNGGESFTSGYATKVTVTAGDYGSVDNEGRFEVPVGTEISENGDRITFRTLNGTVTVRAIPMSGYQFSHWSISPDSDYVMGPTSITAIFKETLDPSPIPDEDPDKLIPGIYHNDDGSITIIRILDDGSYLRTTFFEDMHWIFREHFSDKYRFLGSIETTLDKHVTGETTAITDVTHLTMYRTGVTEVHTLKVYTDTEVSQAIAQADARKIPGGYESEWYSVEFAVDTLMQAFKNFDHRYVDIHLPVAVANGIDAVVTERCTEFLDRSGIGLMVSGTDCWFAMQPSDAMAVEGDLTVRMEYVSDLTEAQADAAKGYPVYRVKASVPGTPLVSFKQDISVGLPYVYPGMHCAMHQLLSDGSVVDIPCREFADRNVVAAFSDTVGMFFAEPVPEPVPEPEGLDVATVIGVTLLASGLAMFATWVAIRFHDRNRP